MSHWESQEKVAVETELLKQENQFLRERINALGAREARWDDERARLVGIIERQTYTLAPAYR